MGITENRNPTSAFVAYIASPPMIHWAIPAVKPSERSVNNNLTASLRSNTQ